MGQPQRRDPGQDETANDVPRRQFPRHLRTDSIKRQVTSDEHARSITPHPHPLASDAPITTSRPNALDRRSGSTTPDSRANLMAGSYATRLRPLLGTDGTVPLTAHHGANTSGATVPEQPRRNPQPRRPRSTYPDGDAHHRSASHPAPAAQRPRATPPATGASPQTDHLAAPSHPPRPPSNHDGIRGRRRLARVSAGPGAHQRRALWARAHSRRCWSSRDDRRATGRMLRSRAAVVPGSRPSQR